MVYTIGEVSNLIQGATVITNAKGITYSGGIIKVESYESYTALNAFSIDGTNLTANLD